MWRYGGSLPNTVVAWRLEIIKCKQCCCWCATYNRLYHFEERYMGRHPELHAVSKELLPRGGVVELVPIVAFDALELAAELGTDNRKELGDSRKGVRL
jgi:hypothetical protein